MPIENCVVNSSPLICLFKSGLIDLLNQIFNKIIVPGAVYKEVTRGTTQDILSNKINTLNWLQIDHNIDIDSNILAWNMGQGESEVLSYALLNKDF